MSEEEKMAKLELNRYIYGKQLSKDDIADYLGILFNLIDNQQKEIEEKTTIIMAGAEKVKQLESQVEELLDVLDSEKKINYIKPIDIPVHNYISKDKIREKIKKAKEIKWLTPKLVIEYFEELLEEE